MVDATSQLTAMLPTDLKRSNQMQILEFIRGKNACTANQIAENVGVSRQTVMKAIQFFIAKGIVVSLGKSHSTGIGGKRPELFSLSTGRYLLSISLWPDLQQLALLNLRGEVLKVERVSEALGDDAQRVITNIGIMSQKLLAQRKIAQDQLMGVCVSTSGIVNHNTNILKFNSLRPAWGTDIPIAERLAPYFAPNMPILVDNVAKVVGRAILHTQELKHKRMLTVFSAWNGICASFIENDCILNGKDSLIGEIGHMIIAPDDRELCGCGSHGCFECLVSNDRLRKSIRENIDAHPDSMLNALPIDHITVDQLFEASAQGDAFAQVYSRQLARYFAILLRNISLVFNPELVVLQGDYAKADENFCQQLYQSLGEFRYYSGETPFEIQLDRRPIAELDVQGAYVFLIDHLFNDPELYHNPIMQDE